MRTATEDSSLEASTSEALSRVRGSSPAKLRQQLTGDLDVIVLKALRKEPQRRYASAEQLAEDIRRHLQGLPVAAVPDSLRYRARKFVHRHKVGVAAAAILLVAIAGGIVATLREAHIAAANQQTADKRFNDVRKLANSLMFEIHDAIEGVPGSTAARKLIVQRSQEYLDSLARETTGDVSLQRELASAYERLGNVQGNAYNANLGDSAGALQSLQKALALRRAIASSGAAVTADQAALAGCYRLIGQVQWQSLGAIGDAAENLKTAVTIASRASSQNTGDPRLLWELAADYSYLADIEGGNGLRGAIGNTRLALEDAKKSLAIFQQLADQSPQDLALRYKLANSKIGVGDNLLKIGERQQALSYYDEARQILGPLVKRGSNRTSSYELAICYSRIGDVYLFEDKPLEALRAYSQDLALTQPLAAADPKDSSMRAKLVGSTSSVGEALVRAGRTKAGQTALRNALKLAQALVDSDNNTLTQSYLATVEMWIGESSERTGDFRAASDSYRRALRRFSKMSAEDPNDLGDAVRVVEARSHLAGASLLAGDMAEASAEYQSALSLAETLYSSDPGNMAVLYAVGNTHAGLGDLSAAMARKAATAENKLSNWSHAQARYQESLQVWGKINHPCVIDPDGFAVRDRDQVARHLAQSSAELSRIARPRPLQEAANGH